MSMLTETLAVQQALTLAHTLLAADSSRVGKIDGKPRTGKTTIAHYQVQHLYAVRVCAYLGMTTKNLMLDLCVALGAGRQRWHGSDADRTPTPASEQPAGDCR